MKPVAFTGLSCIGAALAVWAASRPDEISFEKRLIDPGAYEACAIGDINLDGRFDIVSGANWYEMKGPSG